MSNGFEEIQEILKLKYNTSLPKYTTFLFPCPFWQDKIEV